MLRGKKSHVDATMAPARPKLLVNIGSPAAEVVCVSGHAAITAATDVDVTTLGDGTRLRTLTLLAFLRWSGLPIDGD
jgi:hypothetical protein